MAYRDTTADPRIAGVRKTHLAAELAEVREICRRLEKQVSMDESAIGGAKLSLDLAVRGGPPGGGVLGWLIRKARHDPQEIARAAELVETTTAVHAASVEVLAIAQDRSKLVEAEMNGIEAAAAADPELAAAAEQASLASARALGIEVLRVADETVELVKQAQRQELAAALSGAPIREPLVPAADRAVRFARCRIELLRAALVAIGGSAARRVAQAAEVLAELDRAGSGPGQEWHDAVVKASKSLRTLVESLS